MRKRRKQVVFAFALAVCALAFLIVLRGREPQLMAEAKLALNANSHWFNYCYEWMSDDALWLCRYQDFGIDQDRFSVLSLRTGRMEPIVWLNRLLTKEEFRTDEFKLSPDRLQALILRRGEGLLVPTAGGKARSVSAGTYHADNEWLADNVHWIHTFHGNNGHLLDYPDLTVIGPDDRDHLDKTTGRTIVNSGKNPLWIAGGLDARSTGTTFSSVCRPDSQDEDGEVDRLFVHRRLEQNLSSQTTTIQVVLPQRCRVGYAAVSPDGSRIAVLIAFERGSSMPGWLQRLLPFYKSPKFTVQQLWVLGIDNSDRRLLGSRVVGETDKACESVRWTPSGRRLSFELDNALYTIPSS